MAEQISQQPKRLAERLTSIYAHVQSGNYHPLPCSAFELDDYGSAFRKMRDGKSTGKLVLRSRATPAELQARGDQDTDGWQWIIGGLGGLGILLADDLVERGYKNLALVSRRAPSDAEREFRVELDRLRTRGANVRIFQADVANEQAVAAIGKQLRHTGLAITGVYHLAGNLDDATLANQSRESLFHVLDAKVRGVWNLHRETLDQPVKRFVLFSSASAVFGSPGQANHAAANAFLDAFAQHRKNLRLPALSINWGPWSDVGAAAARSVEKRSDLAGIEMIGPDEGFAVYRILDSMAPESLPAAIAALRINLHAFPAHLRSLPLFQNLKVAEHASTPNAMPTYDIVARISHADLGEQNVLMMDYLRHTVAATLGVRDIAAVSIDQPLFEMGIDSLTSLELVNSLKSALGFAVSTNELFNYPSIKQLAKRLLELHRSGLRQVAVAQQPAANILKPVVEPSVSRDAMKQPAGDDTQLELTLLLSEIGTLSDEFDQWEATR